MILILLFHGFGYFLFFTPDLIFLFPYIFNLILEYVCLFFYEAHLFQDTLTHMVE